MDLFHAKNPKVAVQLNVKRHPYSFNGDSPPSNTPQGEEKTWHDGLLPYCGGCEERRAAAEIHMQALASLAGIRFDYGVQTNWHPVDSQRLMWWAGRHGKQEEYMSALAHRHFECRESASHTTTLLKVVEHLGLSVEAAEKFLASGELVDEVWRSYGSTIHEKGIDAIPFFVFNGPGSNGGPFRPGPGKATIIRGSADPEAFFQVFQELYTNQGK